MANAASHVPYDQNQNPQAASSNSQPTPIHSGSKMMHGRLSLAPHLLQPSGPTPTTGNGQLKAPTSNLHPSLKYAAANTMTNDLGIPSTPVNQQATSLNGQPMSASHTAGRMSLGPARTKTTPQSTTMPNHLGHNLGPGALETTATPFGAPLTKLPQVQFNLPTPQDTKRNIDALPSSRQSLSAIMSAASNATRPPLMPRASMAASSTSSNNPFHSDAPMPASRTSLTARRSSSAAKPGSLSAGSVSLSLANAGATMKDPRPIREKNFQYACIKFLIKFLAESSYDKPISPKILSSPSAKDFQAIFKFLYACLDPGYEWQGKFEEEVPLLLRTLRYPFANDISKSHLLAVGSMHAWPYLLAMLHWMVELILACEQLPTPIDLESLGHGSLSETLAAEPSLLANMGSDLLGESERLFFDYLTKSYKMFLSGDDHYEALQGSLAARFERQLQLATAEQDVLQAEAQRLEASLTQLEGTESPLLRLERERISLEGDIDKYRKFIAHQHAKKHKLQLALDTIDQDIVLLGRDIEALNGERERLEAVIAAQSISPEDVDKMRFEKDGLTKNLEYIYKLKDEWASNIASHEAEFLDKQDILVKLVKEYNDLAERLQLVPVSAKHAHGKNYLLTINDAALQLSNGSPSPSPSSSSTAGNAATTLLSLDLRSQVLPVVEALQDSYHGCCRELSDALQAAAESLDKLLEATTDKIEEISFVEEKIKKMSITYANLKEQTSQENKTASQEMENLERELDTMKNDLATCYLVSQQQLQKVTMEFDTLTRRNIEEKERLGKMIFSLLEDSISLKNHIQTRLEEFQEWTLTQDPSTSTSTSSSSTSTSSSSSGP